MAQESQVIRADEGALGMEGVREMRFIEAAVQIIHEQPGRTAGEIAQLALDRGLARSNATDPLASFRGTLAKLVAEGRERRVYRKQVNGIWYYYPVSPSSDMNGESQYDPWKRSRTRRSQGSAQWYPQIPKLGRLIASALRKSDEFNGAELYLVAVLGYELGLYTEAVKLCDRALSSSLEEPYRSKAENLRRICDEKRVHEWHVRSE